MVAATQNRTKSQTGANVLFERKYYQEMHDRKANNASSIPDRSKSNNPSIFNNLDGGLWLRNREIAHGDQCYEAIALSLENDEAI